MALGVPQGETSFYPSILGAVLFGIGIALVIEWRRNPFGIEMKTRNFKTYATVIMKSGDMALPDSRRSAEQRVAPLLDESTGGQFVNATPLDRWIKTPIELSIKGS